MGDDEGHIIEFLEQTAKCINSIDDQWITKWAALIEKYFKHESRNHIRLKAIALLSQIFSKYHIICGDELMNKIILPHFSDADKENDSVVRRPIVHLLFDITSNCLSYQNCNAILAIIRRILTKPFQHKQHQQQTCGDLPDAYNVAIPSVYSIGNADIIDSRLIIANLNKLFRTKLHRLPIDPAVNMLDISVNYLNLIYRYPLQDPVPAEIPMIRRELFSFFLDLRCNKYGHLGVLSDNKNVDEIEYSPFIICVKKLRASSIIVGSSNAPNRNNHQPSTASIIPSSPKTELPPNIECPTQTTTLPPTQLQTSSSSPMQPSNNHHQRLQSLSYTQHQQNIFVSNALHPDCPIESRCVNLDLVFVGIIDCINQETDSDVLKLVLDELPGLLANKPLVLTAGDERINQLCLALGNLVLPQNRTPNSSASNLMQALSTSGHQQRLNLKVDIAKSALRCLTSLLVYRKLLDHRSIKTMLAAFEDSLKSLTRHPIVPLFTTCLVELQDNSEMSKFVPVVLHRLIKFSPTVNLGTSMLEFLSYLILFPKLYENFSEDEYKFIFAIALPYTNPFRFSDYITCLAFRVIAMWYLKCRPSLRRVFVELVRKSLQSNVIQPFKENHPPLQQSTANVAATINACGGGMNITTPISATPAGLFSQASSPITQTPPITYSCPATMSPMDQRKRSSSLNTENSFRHQQYNQHQMYQAHSASATPTAQSSLQVNEELIETFTDLLSRYTHGQYLAIAPKNRCTEMLIDRSTSQTWLLGNSLITITAGRATNGWAEILVRRPTGNTSWIGRLQNTLGTLPMMNQQSYMNSLNFGSDIISLFSSLTLTSDDGSDNGTESLADLSSISSRDAAISSSLSIEQSSGVGMAGSLRDNGPSNNCNSRLRDPTPLPKDKKTDIALSNFDLITPYETHKVGVIYVGENQVDNRAAILSNKNGSPRYYDFLSKIGTCIILNDIDPEVYFTGGLDVKGADGKYAYFWKDNVTQVIFHVATFMLLRENDPQCHGKNRHIGNDHVCIVYNDSGSRFKLSTIKGTGQFILACIIIVPLDDETNMVEVEMLPELRNIVGEIEPRVLSNVGAPLYARQMAIHLNLGSKIYERRHCEGFFSREPYVSNWVERLRCIKRIRQRLDDNRRTTATTSAGGSISSRASNTLK